MKILIAGSRSITDFDISEYIPEGVEMIISGGARGVDTIAEQYADEHKLSKLILRPNYKKYGRGAPLIRNKKMVDIADMIIVIWDGKSAGARQTVEYTKKVGKELILIKAETNDI